MKIFLTFATTLGLLVSAHAQTTLSNITVNGQAYDITYNTGTYDSFESTIEDNSVPWWGNSTTSGNFVTAINAYDAALNIRFAHAESTFLSNDLVSYADDNGNNILDYQTTSSIYAVNAVAVPAPLPILGILPIVGFLKRMRRRQKAS
jgi:hypothetical protein